MSHHLAKHRGLWDALLRDTEREGYDCDFMKYALRIFPMEMIERKLEEAKARKLKNLQKVHPNAPKKHWSENDKD